jgi:hypothetical protein
MAVEIKTVHDEERGCGWRKAGGLYLVADEPGVECGRLPILLEICPTCGQGVKFSRSWTWIDPVELVRGHPCMGNPCEELCVLSNTEVAKRQRDGLLWVGREHYATAGDFIAEADRLGISRRIKSVPRGFVVGVTVVWLAHLEAVPTREKWMQGVFRVFRPMVVEYVVTGEETNDDLEKLVARGITPIRVERVGEQLDLV